MLLELRIKNLAVIDRAEIPFQKGLNILSGETGAGKSIIIQAISLLLGSRASADLIRAGTNDASVEGLFHVADMPWVRDRLTKAGFEVQRELLIKRVLSRTGRPRVYINGDLATLAILQNLCQGLVDLCGQHEHQSLVRTNTQLDLIDRYGGLMKKLENYKQAFSHYRSLKAEQQVLEDAAADRNKRHDFLKYQIDEIKAERLHPHEDLDLQAEKKLLQTSEQRMERAQAVCHFLEGQDSEAGAGAIQLLRQALGELRKLAQTDPDLETSVERLRVGLDQIEEVDVAVNRYLSDVKHDPARLGEIQERLARIAELKRKYGSDVASILGQLENLEGEFQGLEEVGQRLKQVGAKLEVAIRGLRKNGELLASGRKKVAALLSDSVTGELSDLKMGEAEFQIALEFSQNLEDWNAKGPDQVQYMIQTNRGEASMPIGKVASGGELSRVMLAIRRVIADRGRIGVYLFDEIDAGIGGQTAFQVGRKLKSVSSYNQVICITHLPQVASFADHHLVVEKAVKGKRTQTTVEPLNQDGRKHELARMLGGDQVTKSSLGNANELLRNAREAGL